MGPVYRFHFTSTTNDILEAEEAERTKRWGRPFFRWLVIGLGLMWLAGAAGIFGYSKRWWQPVVWLLLGLGILYSFIVKPFQRRKRIRENLPPSQELSLEFGMEALRITATGAGVFSRDWSEFVKCVEAKKGVLLYFKDGIKNWLPHRVFESKEQRKQFVKYLEQKLNRNASNGGTQET